MSDYLLQHGTRQTDQSEEARPEQIPNSAGGYVWAVDNWTRLRRFLILGSEGGSYYASQRDLTIENISAVRACIAENGPRTVVEITNISERGRAPKNDPALYALAACISLGDKDTKRLAAESLPRVARIGTHLYHFVAYAETMRGWGRTMRWAISNWYESKGDRLDYDVIKYRQRDGWSHRDLLRLAHPSRGFVGEGVNTAATFAWITHPDVPESAAPGALIEAFEAAQIAETPKLTAALIREWNLPREAVRPEHLNDLDVWQALLDVGMPMTAMIRNLATMTRIGLLTPTADATKTVLEALKNQESITKARVHPLAILFGMATYASGHGFRGSNTWSPLPQVVDALDGAFYLAFGNVEPTGKRILLALDVSSSMRGGSVAGTPLDPCTCAAAMALITAKTEPLYECVGFYARTGGYRSGRSRWGGEDGITPIPLSARQRLDDVVKMTSNLPFGGTDCALPMLYAAAEKKNFDAFLVFTDSETWAGNVHPFQALRQYREQFVADAKLVVVGMVSNGFTIADPSDAGMMDVVGMDTATPGVISEFVAGRL